MKDFRSLIVWQQAAALTDLIYPLIARYPPSEERALIPQMRRAAQSIELNIAEGCGRRTDAQFANSLNISMGSASELENCLDISRRHNLGLADLRLQAEGLVTEVKKMLAALIRRLDSTRPPSRKRKGS